MPKPFSFLFTRHNSTTKKSPKPFKDFYNDWFATLKTTLLPLLHQSLYSSSPTLLSSHVEILLNHLLYYYTTLDLAAVNHRSTVAHLLFPPWRNPLEKPFLFLGDLHPYLFTNLLRSFLDDSDLGLGFNSVNSGFDSVGFFDAPWQVVMAWKDPPKNLTARIEQIECGLRLMVPSLINRLRKVQGDFVRVVAEEWVKSDGEKEDFEIGVGLDLEMEELTSVFTDANRLRRSVISEITSSLSVYQAALFLEGLAQILVGFRDQKLVNEFENCKKPITDQRARNSNGV